MASPNITVQVKGGTTKVVTAPRLQVTATSFGVVNVATQNNIIATIPTDTLQIVAGTGILLTTDNVNNQLTIVATGGSAFDQFARDQANSAFNEANTANVTGQAAFNRANSAYSNANTAIYTAAQIRANISNTAPVNYDPSTGIISHALSGVTATTYGNTTFVPTITVDNKGHITSVVNTAIALPPSTDEFARTQANAAYNQANTANVTGQAAFDKANSAIFTAAQIRANISNTAPINYDPATGIISHNTSGVTATTYGNTAFVPTITVDNEGHVTSVTNTSIAISATAITSGTLAVGRGGTGQTASSLVNGAVLIGNTVSGGYDVNTLTQGTGILITNAPGSITIDTSTGKAYYFENGTLSDVGVYHKLLAKPSTLSENTISFGATGTLSYTLVSSFITANGEPNVTLLPAGVYGRHIYATTGASNQVGRLRIEVYKYAANALETLIQTADSPDFWSGNENPLLTWNLANAAGYPLDLTDRILVKWYAARVSGPATCNIDIFTQGNTRASYTTTTILGTSGTTVTSVAGRTGDVVLNTNDVTENAAGPYYHTAARVRGNVSNTAPINYEPTTGIFSHALSGVTATGYGTAAIVPKIVVDDKGHVTSVTNTGIAIDASAITSGILLVDRGGTGQGLSYANGQLLIGNTVSGGLDKATLTQGSGILITNDKGSITIAATGGSAIDQYARDKANGAAQNSFVTLNVAGQSDIVADSNVDTLIIVGSGIVIETNAGTDTLTIRHPASGVTASGYGDAATVPKFEVDANGHVTSVTNTAIAIAASQVTSGILAVARGGTGKDATGLANGQILIGNTVNTGFDLTTIAQSAPVIVTNDKGSITLSHARSGVTAATLGGSDRVIGYTVDANGHITATTNVAIALLDAGVIATGTLVVARGGTGQSTYTNGQILIGNTGSTGLDKSTIAQTTPIIVTNTQGLINLSHASTTVVADTYGGSNRVIGYTVDQFGHLTAASNVAIDQLPAAAITTGILTVGRGGTGKDATGLANGQILIGNTVNTGFDLTTIAQTAPVIVTNGKGTITLSHASSGVVATGYGTLNQIPVFVVDTFGHVTGVTNTAIGSLDAGVITSGTLSVTRGGTGQSTYSNGDLLIGNTISGGLDRANLTQGTGISITNANGAITIAAIAGTTYYLENGTLSDVGVYHKALTSPSTLAENTIAFGATGTLSFTLLSSFITNAGEPNVTLLPPGTYGRHIHATTGGVTQVGRLRVELYKYAANGLETLLRTADSPDFWDTGSTGLLTWNVTDPVGYALATTDRLLWKLYAARVSGPGTCNISIFTQGNTQASYFTTTILGISGSTVTSVAGRTGDVVLNTNDVTENAAGPYYFTAAKVRANISNTFPIGYDPTTGVISLPSTANGQILIGNTVNTGFDLAAITQTAPVIVSTDKGSIRLSHARSGVNANTYGSASLIPVITVDDNGHITVATTAATSGLPAATANGQTLIGNTVSGSFDVALIAQSAPVIVTNGKGTITLSHARSGVIAGTYGAADVVGRFTVDSNGHITEAVNDAISLDASAIAAGTLTPGVGGTGNNHVVDANGLLFIGNTISGYYDVNTLTQGTGIVITNAPGAITIAASGTGAGAIIKQNVISIGATAVESLAWVVTDVDVTTGSFITGSIAYIAQTGKELDEMEMDQIDLKFAPAAGSFTVYVTGLTGMISGNFTFNYTIY